MDFKSFINSKRNNESDNNRADGGMRNDQPMNDIESQFNHYKNKSQDELMDELRRAKQNGQINEQSVRQFMDTIGRNLSDQQRMNILNLLNNLK